MYRYISNFILIILLILAICFPVFAGSFTGKVIGVLDGDTIEVLVNKKSIRVRLHGIDCPEKGQPRENRAKWYASGVAFKKTVSVTVKDVDRYGRIVGEVILQDGKSLNKEMVRAGYAWWYRKYAPDDKELAALEEAARAARIGLWSLPEPIPPWEWRRGTRSPSTYEPEQPRSPPIADSDTIVYITKTGEKLHREDVCRYMSRTGNRQVKKIYYRTFRLRKDR
jgi:endonuclease YncB( thermonuclease family)